MEIMRANTTTKSISPPTRTGTTTSSPWTGTRARRTSPQGSPACRDSSPFPCSDGHELLMVVQAHIEHQSADLAALQQHLRTLFGMQAHAGELAVRKLAGLVENGIGDCHLADVMQQTGLTRLAHKLLGQPQLSGQGNHQGANRHRV